MLEHDPFALDPRGAGVAESKHETVEGSRVPDAPSRYKPARMRPFRGAFLSFGSLMLSAIFHPVMPEAELAEGQPAAAEIEGRAIMICRWGDQVYALDNLCTHSGARLALGRVVKGVISCPLHGAKFELATGECRSLHMGLLPVITHQTRVANGWVEVALSPRPVTPPLT